MQAYCVKCRAKREMKDAKARTSVASFAVTVKTGPFMLL